MYINSVLTCHFLLWFKWWSISTQSRTLSLSKGSNPYGRAKPALYHSVPLGYFRWVWVPDKLPPIPFLPSKTFSRECASSSLKHVPNYENVQIFDHLVAIIRGNRITNNDKKTKENKTHRLHARFIQIVLGVWGWISMEVMIYIHINKYFI